MKEILDISHQVFISNVITKRRWSFIGHILRINKNIIPYSPYTGLLLVDEKEADLCKTIHRESTLMNLKNIQKLKPPALNRQVYRTIVFALCDNHGTGGSWCLISDCLRMSASWKRASLIKKKQYLEAVFFLIASGL